MLLENLPFISGILALLFVFYFAFKLMKEDAGSEKMQELSHAIHEGAMAFLFREYKVLSIFVVIVFLILGFLLIQDVLINTLNILNIWRRMQLHLLDLQDFFLSEEAFFLFFSDSSFNLFQYFLLLFLIKAFYFQKISHFSLLICRGLIHQAHLLKKGNYPLFHFFHSVLGILMNLHHIFNRIIGVRL